jgi:Icc-related predicted phosphoesterase
LIFYPFDPENFVRAREAWEARGRPAIDILMTHEAPYDVGMKGDPRIAALFGLPPDQIMGEPALRDLWQAVRPRLQVNGHHHRLNRHEEDGLRHLTLPTSQRGCALLDTATWQDEFFSTGT